MPIAAQDVVVELCVVFVAAAAIIALASWCCNLDSISIGDGMRAVGVPPPFHFLAGRVCLDALLGGRRAQRRWRVDDHVA